MDQIIAVGISTLVILAGIACNFRAVDRLSDQMDERFGQVDARFGQVDARFGRVDAQLNQIRTELTVIQGDLRRFYHDLGLHEADIETLKGGH